MTLTQPAVYQDRHILMDHRRHEAKVDGKVVNLTTTEWRMMSYFTENAGKAISWEYLTFLVYGDGYQRLVDPMQVRWHIWNLRRKLGWEVGAGPLQTVRGFGYRYDPEFVSAEE